MPPTPKFVTVQKPAHKVGTKGFYKIGASKVPCKIIDTKDGGTTARNKVYEPKYLLQGDTGGAPVWRTEGSFHA